MRRRRCVGGDSVASVLLGVLVGLSGCFEDNAWGGGARGGGDGGGGGVLAVGLDRVHRDAGGRARGVLERARLVRLHRDEERRALSRGERHARERQLGATRGGRRGGDGALGGGGAQ